MRISPALFAFLLGVGLAGSAHAVADALASGPADPEAIRRSSNAAEIRPGGHDERRDDGPSFGDDAAARDGTAGPVHPASPGEAPLQRGLIPPRR